MRIEGCLFLHPTEEWHIWNCSSCYGSCKDLSWSQYPITSHTWEFCSCSRFKSMGSHKRFVARWGMAQVSPSSKKKKNPRNQANFWSQLETDICQFIVTKPYRASDHRLIHFHQSYIFFPAWTFQVGWLVGFDKLGLKYIYIALVCVYLICLNTTLCVHMCGDLLCEVARANYACGGQRWASGVLLICLPPCLLTQALSLSLKLINLGSLPHQLAQGLPCLYLLSAKIT